MQPLITSDFLLENNSASRLYHEFAEMLPIIDFHSHLPPQEIAVNQSWSNLTQVWLDGDFYKWRAMRANGIGERYCTGEASDFEKFNAFASTMPYLLRNPLYHWSHLELSRYFDIDDILLSPATAQEVWDRTKDVFERGLAVSDLLKKSKVELVCTSDDPADTLEHHQSVATNPDLTVRMLPTWRPDLSMAIEDSEMYLSYLERLATAAEMRITNFDDLIEALRKRHTYFHEMGCRLSDHGIDVFSFCEATQAEVRRIFLQILSGAPLSVAEICKFRSMMLLEFARMDAEKGWTKQLHIGALRFNNSRMQGVLGYDSIDDRPYAADLARYLDTLDSEGQLPKMILYNLNPSDNEMIATMIGNFQDGITPGKIQFGSGWWFLDQKNGMERQLEALSQLGLMRRFVGMVTDSRSFLSYTRHEYFRRVLCNLLGREIEHGLLPRDFDLVGALVQDVCFRNPATYFGFLQFEN